MKVKINQPSFQLFLLTIACLSQILTQAILPQTLVRSQYLLSDNLTISRFRTLVIQKQIFEQNDQETFNFFLPFIKPFPEQSGKICSTSSFKNRNNF